MKLLCFLSIFFSYGKIIEFAFDRYPKLITDYLSPFLKQKNESYMPEWSACVLCLNWKKHEKWSKKAEFYTQIIMPSLSSIVYIVLYVHYVLDSL